MNRQNLILIIIILTVAIIDISQGLSLTKSKVRSCLGEEVVFTCTTEGSSLSWRVIVTRDPNLPALTYTFFYHYYEMQSRRRKVWSEPGFRIELELVSVEPMIVSTLSATLTNMIIDTEVTCRQSSQAQTGRFSLARAPSIPVQTIDVDYQYGCINFNVSLSWIPPQGDHRTDYYRLRLDGQAHVIINDTSYMVDSLPYSENATIEIDIVNCAGEGAESYVTVNKGGCLSLNSSENSCLKPAGYQTTIECEPGEVPKEILSTCRENGSWIPDEMGCTEIQFFCGNQTNQKFKGKPCVDNSLWREFMGHAWSPDIKSGHIKCAADRKSTDVHTQGPLGTHMYLIIGASTGCGAILLLIVLMCVCLCIIRKLCKKRRYNVDQTDSLYPDSELQYKLGETDPQDASMPQYETISPLYDVIPGNTGTNHSEIYLRMMNNNAYCGSGAKCIQ